MNPTPNRTGIPEKDQASFANSEPSRPWNARDQLGRDSAPRDGVPRRRITKHAFKSETVYPDVARNYWLYVPTQYDKPACLMVFQDGGLYLRGPDVKPTAVFDNLIHRKEIPVTVGLFVNPGDTGPGSPVYGGTDNRSFEYDSLGNRYARFLIEELLPEVRQAHAITDDPAGRAICGFSSGGICAFTVAWERPCVAA